MYLFLKDCEDALQVNKPEQLSDEDWVQMNKKVVAYAKMCVTDDILTDIKSLNIG